MVGSVDGVTVSVSCSWLLDRSADGETDGLADGETDGEIDGETDGEIDGSADGRSVSVDGETDGETDGEIDGSADGRSVSADLITPLFFSVSSESVSVSSESPVGKVFEVSS